MFSPFVFVTETHFPTRMSQIRTVLSPLAVLNWSGFVLCQHNWSTDAVWPRKTLLFTNRSRSKAYTATVLSNDPEAKWHPLAFQQTEWTCVGENNEQTSKYRLHFIRNFYAHLWHVRPLLAYFAMCAKISLKVFKCLLCATHFIYYSSKILIFKNINTEKRQTMRDGGVSCWMPTMQGCIEPCYRSIDLLKNSGNQCQWSKTNDVKTIVTKSALPAMLSN